MNESIGQIHGVAEMVLVGFNCRIYIEHLVVLLAFCKTRIKRIERRRMKVVGHAELIINKTCLSETRLMQEGGLGFTLQFA